MRTIPVPSSSDASVRTLIVDDDLLFAEALEFVLVADGIAVDAIAAPGPDALDDVRRGRPNVVILGVETPTAAVVRRGETILETCRTARVLVLATILDRAHVQRVFRAGLHCMPKTSSVSHFVRTVRALANGGSSNRSELVTTAGDAAVGQPAGMPGTGLTPRELEVLKLLATGAAGRTIARRLGISENTVRTHSQSILVKLRMHSRLEAAAYAIRTGLVRLRSPETDEFAV